MRFLSVILLFSSVILTGQSGFQFIDSLGYDQRASDAIELENGDYVFSIWDQGFLHLDSEGNFIDKAYIGNDSTNVILINIHKTETGYIGFGRTIDWISDYEKLWVGKFDEDFEWESYFEYDIIDESERHYLLDSKMKNDSILFFYGSFIPDFIIFSGEININSGDIISNEESIEYLDIISGAIIDEESNGYIYWGDHLYYVDSMYNIYQKIWEPGFSESNFKLSTQGHIKRYNDSLFLITGKCHEINLEGFGLMIGVFDENLSIVKYDTINFVNYKRSFPAINESMCLTLDSNIYFGGTLNTLSYFIPGYTNEIFLALYDYDLNKIWEKTYSWDGYYVFSRGIMATSDGGCLSYGKRRHGDVLEIYIIKVDENGVISGETIIPESENFISLYPNPVDDILHVENLNGLYNMTFELFNIEGKLILSTELSSDSIDFRFVKMGNYVYKISNIRGEIIQSGKIIKL